MYKGKLKKTFVFVLLVAGVAQAGLTAHSAISSQAIERYANKTAHAAINNAAAGETDSQGKDMPKEAVDTSNIVLKPEVEDRIASLSGGKAVNNIKNYKTLLAALKVPARFQEKIEDMYFGGHKTEDVLIAYEYLYQNYGNIEELGGLLERKETGKTWRSIFKEFGKGNGQFEPGTFPEGKLEKILRIPGITPDDVIIADRISQKLDIEFDELIAMRKKGKDWMTINEETGIVNTSGELPRAVITSAQVKSYMKSSGLSEEKVIEALALAQRLGMEGKAVIDKFKGNNTENDIIADGLEVKYRQQDGGMKD